MGRFQYGRWGRSPWNQSPWIPRDDCIRWKGRDILLSLSTDDLIVNREYHKNLTTKPNYTDKSPTYAESKEPGVKNTSHMILFICIHMYHSKKFRLDSSISECLLRWLAKPR